MMENSAGLRLHGTRRLTTPRLVLRRFSVRDASAMFRNWACDGLSCRFLSWSPHQSVEETRMLLEGWVAQYTRKDALLWAIQPREGIQPVGSVSMHAIDVKNRSAELGFCLSSAYWGKGIATEAVHAVVGFCFERCGFQRIYGRNDPRNTASGRVMEKCGLRYEGLQRQAALIKGNFCDLELRAVTLPDYHGHGEDIRLDGQEV